MQACPHEPQFALSVLVSVHQPMLVALTPHPVCPVGHTHVLPVQVDPDGQTWAQVPQLPKSLVVSVHPPPQSASPPGHTQALAMQLVPNGQALPHEPQFVMSVVVSAHDPKSPPQSPRPVGHMHIAPALASQVRYVEQLSDAHTPIAVAIASRLPQASVVSAASMRR